MKIDGNERINEVSQLREEQRILRQSLQEAHARLERAEAANRAKDQFLATLSHELRTPLNSMLGWAQMLASDDLDDTMRARAIRSIERNTKLQAQLIDDLLDVSRIISGKLKVDKRLVEAIPLIAAVAEGFRREAAAKNIDLTVAIEPAGDLIAGDPNRVQQIIGNLIANALKFTPRGGNVRVTVEPAGDDRLRISVADTGRGIAPGLLPFIFERFRQGDSGETLSATKGSGGLGLGLAIARHLVELHGGSLAATSDGEGCGATFTVELPVLEPSSAAARRLPSVAPRSTAKIQGEPLRGISILVVDDEPDARDLIATMLAQFGARVTQAASAAEAFASLCAQGPDVLVSDIAMPGEDGYDLVRRVRSQPRERIQRTPAIAVTAYATRQDRQRALNAGFDRHLAKPIEAADLVGAIAHLLGRRA